MCQSSKYGKTINARVTQSFESEYGSIWIITLL